MCSPVVGASSRISWFYHPQLGFHNYVAVVKTCSKLQQDSEQNIPYINSQLDGIISDFVQNA